MTRIVFRNASIWDGTGAAPFNGDVLVQDDRIAAIARETGQLAAQGAREIDAAGRFLMPGLVEGHAHLSFSGAIKDSDMGDIPPEEHLLLTMRNAATLLDHGFTSAYSAASAKLRLDVVIRNEVDAGRLPGPRIRAASPEITVTGGLGDERRNHMYKESFGMVADGADDLVRVVRTCAREGVDIIKINISGDDLGPLATGDITVMKEHEVAAAAETARDFNKKTSCHARSAESVKRALRCGIDVIYHGEGADEEALDMLEAARDRIFVGPAIGLIHNTLYESEHLGTTMEQAEGFGMRRILEQSAHVYGELRKRGVRTVIGGDYGFACTPQGTNARDLEHFVDLLGYSASEALQCATRVGGELMWQGDDIGLIREGWLADLLLVDGDPLADLSIMTDATRLAVIMKDGKLHKNAPVESGARRQAAE